MNVFIKEWDGRKKPKNISKQIADYLDEFEPERPYLINWTGNDK